MSLPRRTALFGLVTLCMAACGIVESDPDVREHHVDLDDADLDDPDLDDDPTFDAGWGGNFGSGGGYSCPSDSSSTGAGAAGAAGAEGPAPCPEALPIEATTCSVEGVQCGFGFCPFGGFPSSATCQCGQWLVEQHGCTLD